MSRLIEPLHPDAYALRPVRFLFEKNEIRNYEATTFPNNPWAGCELYLYRCQCFGYLVEDDNHFLVDVLNKDGDPIQEYVINKKGFEYLRKELKFKVDK